ncbi:MAG: hypothetical protein V3U11_03915 [Planctomycetota bacterium]
MTIEMVEAQMAFLQVVGGVFVLSLLGLGFWILIGALTHED